jgi:hypothetical protein
MLGTVHVAECFAESILEIALCPLSVSTGAIGRHNEFIRRIYSPARRDGMERG